MQYLTSLREKHKLQVGHSKSTSLPQEGDCVLITDPMQPRHCWRMGRITELVAGADGEIREAVVILPSRRQIRRPVNLLVPLELEDRTEKTKDLLQETQEEEPQKAQEEPARTRYDLRPRKRIGYNKERRAPFLLRISISYRISPPLTLFASILFLCLPSLAHPTNWVVTNSLRNIQCFAGGVEIRSEDHTPYEICADNFCQYFELPQALETVHFPPQVLVHEQNVHWKMKRNNSIQIVELTCPPASFFLRNSGAFTGLLHMQPNVPIMWKFFTFTLSSITLPPIPLLNRPFISDGNTTALWDYRFRLPLRCANRTAAKKLQCQFEENCTCFPAESQANCKCSNVSLSSWFNNINHVLPAVFSSVSFKLGQEGEVQASIANMVTAEIIMTVQGNFTTDVIVEDAVCKIENADLQGCYKCAKGAMAEVTCTSTRDVQAEVICDGATFTVGCSKDGTKSVLRFSFNSARIYMKCSVSCGSIPTEFQLGGILKFTQTGQSILTQWVEGGTSSISETEWPDFSHIIDVVAQWYKTALLVTAILLILLALTYVIFSACGIRCFLWIFKQLLRLLRTVLLAPFRCISALCVHVAKESHNKTH
ncbi:unnamed protein product [Cylicocyclus nassatus]|uniref:Phlebovirus glycoprotein G2 fusion domain-containing protein n=1 Tax=Cylicocyclus nassatus TaxID=53992 RepID=A0AA36GNV8_CYLNA|nr:unnamed protein product [Cylicocyclus nassatus]